MRRWPMVPGIDLAGTVVSSTHAGCKAGDEVLVNGWGVRETHYGGYAQMARVKGEWLVTKPARPSARESDGHRHGRLHRQLCVLALERLGVSRPAARSSSPAPPAASAAWRSRCWRSSASGRGLDGRTRERPTSRPSAPPRSSTAPSFGSRPPARQGALGRRRSTGRQPHARQRAAQTRYGGTVAACGLAQGMDLPTTVVPFILRGVTLLGIDSVMAPKPERVEAWSRLARDLDKREEDRLDMTRVEPMSKLVELAGARSSPARCAAAWCSRSGTDVPDPASHGSATNSGICRGACLVVRVRRERGHGQRPQTRSFGRVRDLAYAHRRTTVSSRSSTSDWHAGCAPRRGPWAPHPASPRGRSGRRP